MADGAVGVSPDVTGLGPLVDTDEITVDGQTVNRQRIVMASPSDAAALAAVKAAVAASTDYGLVVRLASPIDATTGAINVVDYAHHEIHGGSFFHAMVVDISMADTETISLAFKTPTGTKRAHMFYRFESKAGAHLEILEGPTWTQGTGVATAIYNRKRLASMTSSILLEDRNQVAFTASNQVIASPTLSGGTVIETVYAFGATRTAAGARDDNEIILKPDTTYAYRITADANTNAAWLSLNWYEHTDSA